MYSLKTKNLDPESYTLNPFGYMPSQKNISAVQDLSDKLARARALVLTDLTGLSVSDQRRLRQDVLASGGQLTVAKNTLVKLALTQKNDKLLPQVMPALTGPTALLLALEDEIAPIKALVKFSDEHERPHLKLAIVFSPEDHVLSAEEVRNLAKIPGRQELLSRLLSTLNAPISRLANALSGNLGKLVYILNAIRESNQQARN